MTIRVRRQLTKGELDFIKENHKTMTIEQMASKMAVEHKSRKKNEPKSKG